MSAIPHPSIVSREEWTAERLRLLAEEKKLTKHYDKVNAQRRRLPMVKLDKKYEFEGPSGNVELLDLFERRRQLIVYHFMFDPTWDKGCPGCTGLVNALGDLSMLADRDTSFVLVSRAPLEKLDTYKRERGWDWPWYSSFSSDFNYDFNATLDKSASPLQYNYRDQEEREPREAAKPNSTVRETHGLSVFFQMDGLVFHTDSTFARGCESLTDAYRLLDRIPYGRQEDFENSPAGWPQRLTYG